MQRQAKKTVLTVVRPTHVDLFVEYYDELRRWAVKFTEGDPERAEDLLHDLFIHFTLAKPDLELIQNLESYLYVVMRNLHLSQVRRATRAPLRSLSAVEYDTGDVSLWWSDPRDRLKMRDELVTVCQYACFRRQSSKAGSVLILRFFHGYYPEEIALVLRSSRSAVDNRLLSARAEARTYLTDPAKLDFIDGGHTTSPEIAAERVGEDLMAGLRRQIFQTRQGECITNAELSEMYAADANGPGRIALAHIVACEKCLDEVNDMLEIPHLAARYPLDTVGKDPGNKDGDDGGPGGGTGGSGGGKMIDKYLLRRDALYHHRPEELCVSVNGHMQSFQKIAAAKSELTLVIDMFENLGFVEVFSEQGMRLLLMNVEPPPNGEAKQSTAIELSNGRKIEANLSFGGAFPTLQVAYNDPTIELEPGAVVTAETQRFGEDLSVPSEIAGGDFASLLGSTRGYDWRAWFQPMRIAVAAVVLMVAAFGIWLVNQPPVPEPLVARAVLKQARDAEFALAPTADKVLHRNYQIEEWADGNLKSRKRIDEWRQTKVAARRTYDEEGQMVAGTWTKEDGSQQVFEQGERLRTVYKRDVVEEVTIEPTANSFANLIDRHGVTSRVTVAELPAQYTFNFEDRAGQTEQRGISDRLIAATLTLDRKTFNPIAQTITLQVGNELREYRFSDVVVEQKPIAEVSPLIFEPEAELAKGATKVTKPLQIELPKLSEPGAAATGSGPNSTNTATLETEVEVFKALDSINALSGDQISITRTANGRLKVTGIVDSPQRKTEILNALSSLRNEPGVSIDVQTAAEAQAKNKQTITGDNITIESRTAEVSRQLPVEPELRSYFARRGIAEDRMAAEVRVFSASVLNRAEALSRNALALKSLAERFSRAEIERLEPKKREEWKRLLRSKAAAVAGDVRSLQSQLSPVFGGSISGGDAGDVEDPARAAQQLFGLAAACERQINQSFAVTTGGGSAAIKSAQFWRNLGQMAAIAGELQKF